MSPPTDGYRMLLVEDDPDHVVLVRAVFGHLDPGAEIHDVNCAEKALVYLRDRIAGVGSRPDALPDVIVLDVQMPGIGGVGFLEQLVREPPLLRALPIVVFTSAPDAELRKRCFALGAREFRMKPTDFSELVGVVHRVLDPSGVPLSA